MHKKLFTTIMISALASALILVGCKQLTGSPVAPKENFSAGSVSQDTKSVTMVITADEIGKLDQLQGLLMADLRGSECYEEIYAWAQAHPEVSVRFLRDGSEEFFSPGDGRADSCVYALLGRDAAAPKMGTGAAAWTHGTPKESGLYVMETDFDGMRSGPDIYRYDADTGWIRLPRNCYQVEDMVCLRYIRLPED